MKIDITADELLSIIASLRPPIPPTVTHYVTDKLDVKMKAGPPAPPVPSAPPVSK